jgi:hypothetical protein
LQRRVRGLLFAARQDRLLTGAPPYSASGPPPPQKEEEKKDNDYPHRGNPRPAFELAL